jgi:hypothetical protein
MSEMRSSSLLLPVGLAAAALALAGCGGSGKKSGAPTAPSTTPGASTPATPTAPAGTNGAPAGALQAEANSTATGDIPDNQVFLTFRNPSAGYTIKYPEGWAQQGSADRVTFRDKNNIVRVLVLRHAPPTAASLDKELAALRGAHVQGSPRRTTVSGAPAFKVVYTTESAPNPVTGKRVTLMVDRYYLAHAGKEAIVDLGTPVGVDNVDAYRLMIASFRWR